MKNRYLLGAGVALAMAFSWANAQAQLIALPAPGTPGAWYFGGEGGWTALDNAGTRLAVPPVAGVAPGGTTISGTERFRDGFNVGARAGYEWGPLRLEEEFSFRQNGIASFLGVPTHGNRNTYAIMTNAIYDFTLGWPITPHLGVGIGAVELHDAWGTGPFVVAAGTGSPPTIAAAAVGAGTKAKSTSWEFGYQGIAGVRYNINPALAFDVDYRYLATTDPTFTSTLGRYRSEYSSHSVVASLSLRFGAPPPPAVAPPVPPAPPPVMRKVFLVFFDWDKDTITPEGMAILQQAAATFRAGAPVTIQVTGYTDRSGSPGYNQRLSERRANNVANGLVRLGVPRQAMAVSGRGENDNRVPTAPGVREPQNRRVEIVFP